MTNRAFDKIACGLNEALAVAEESPPTSHDALRKSAAMFAQCLIDDVARRQGAQTPEQKAAIRDDVVQEIRARFFAKDITPENSA